MEIIQQYFTDTYSNVYAYPFLLRMLIVTILSAMVCSLLSVFVVLKRMAFLSQGIGFAAIGGLALGLMFSPVFTSQEVILYSIAAAFCIVIALLTAFAARTGRIPIDSAIGVYMVGGMALGFVLFSWKDFSVDFFQYIFGSVIQTTNWDILLLVILLGVVFFILFIFTRELYATCFDSAFASIIGIPTAFLHYLLILLLTVTIMITVKASNILLVTSLLIIPGACARLVTMNFKWMFVVSLFVGILSSVTGIVFAVLLSRFSPEALIVLVQLLVFSILLLFHRLHYRGEP